MSDKLNDAVKMLREYCGGIPLSNAIINIVRHDIAVEELINKLREENSNCKAQYQHWDEKYSEALIKMREMKEEIERLKTEAYLYKSSMNHYKGITLKNKKTYEENNTMYNDPFLYPLTVVFDRYCSCYSGGKYTAWNLLPECVPEEINGGDDECFDFWLNKKDDYIYGLGSTPEEAIKDLYKKIMESI